MLASSNRGSFSHRENRQYVPQRGQVHQGQPGMPPLHNLCGGTHAFISHRIVEVYAYDHTDARVFSRVRSTGLQAYSQCPCHSVPR